MDGDRCEDHPELEDAVSKLLAELNAEVDAANMSADAAAAEAAASADEYRSRLPA